MTAPATLTVRNVMTADIATVKTTDPVSAAIELMTANDIGSVIVTDDGKPVGILTERDILKRVCPEHLCIKGVTVGEIMSAPLVHIKADAGLGQASSLMAVKDVRRLLVMDRQKVVGIVTQKDVLRGTLEIFTSLASM
ncbi:MAG: CBS domain-containing protein [Deltaproteobacteria bacterium]|nr:CBS domain-containing protein [Deltaproteobacteria bacterium]MBW2077166.1 CBS domain-containing protein [Deltaproteobacteria bacterium]